MDTVQEMAAVRKRLRRIALPFFWVCSGVIALCSGAQSWMELLCLYAVSAFLGTAVVYRADGQLAAAAEAVKESH